MDRNNMRASYVSSGTRSLPHLGKRHSNGHAHAHAHTHAAHTAHAHTQHSARLSPPAPAHNPSQHDDIINYIYDSWNKVSRELERGGGGGGGGAAAGAARYHQEAAPRALAHFRPFNLDEWWGRRLLQALNRKHRS